MSTTESLNCPINSQLSADCLHLIFSQFTLTEQISLRSICRHWHSLINNRILQGKQTLKLFSTQHGLNQFLFSISTFKIAQEISTLSVGNVLSDVLIIKSTNAYRVIPKLFPNVTNLVAHCPDKFEHFDDLLENWSQNMNSIIIFCMPECVPANLWHRISALPHLERLYLIKMLKSGIPLEYPIESLSKLKHFSIGHYTGDILPILLQLGPQLESLKLSWITLNVFQLERLIEQNPVVLDSLRQLSFGGIISCSTGMKHLDNFRLLIDLICKRFTKLNLLDIIMSDQLPLVTLIPILSQLTNLTDIWLYIGQHQLDSSLTSLDHLPQLRSVKTLYLEIYDIAMEEFLFWIGHIFPNIQSLTVKCEDCKHNYDIDFVVGNLKKKFKFLEKIIH